MQKLKNWIYNYNFILLIFTLLAIIASLQRYFPAHDFNGKFSYYNNFILFKNSIHHLLENKDMYIAYENEGAWDLYKYSPTFAVFMLPYAFIPDLPGLILWNFTNVLLVFWAIRSLPGIVDRNKYLLLWFIGPELLLSLQSSQSNAALTALMVLSFVAFEKNKTIWAALHIGLAACIKPYGIIAAILFLFYPGKLKFILSSIITGVVLVVLPLLLVSYDNLLFQYESWFNMLANDYSSSTGLSIMAIVNDIYGAAIDKKIVILIGTLLTFSPLLFYKKFTERSTRLHFLALILIWVVIFNHKSESPTFIIAVIGVGLWYFSQVKNNSNLVLLLLVLIFTELSPSDIFPPYLRREIFTPYHIKVIPCFLVWIKIIIDLYQTGLRQAPLSINEFEMEKMQ
jgi:hypothetical protein